MNLVLCTAGVIAGWVVLMLVTTNLVGFVGRGFLQPIVTPELRAIESSGGPVAAEISGMRRAGRVVTAVSVLLMIGFLWWLGATWNVGVTAAAVLLMVSRAPDLVWEIRTGHKVTSQTMPKGLVSEGAGLLTWIALPVLWFFVCR
jgi:hypothetical protein